MMELQALAEAGPPAERAGGLDVLRPQVDARDPQP